MRFEPRSHRGARAGTSSTRERRASRTRRAHASRRGVVAMARFEWSERAGGRCGGSVRQTARCDDVCVCDGRSRQVAAADVRARAARAPSSAGLGMADAAHLNGRRGRLRVRVVPVGRDGAGGRHHHRVRHCMLHCSKITISHHGLSSRHQVIRDRRTLRALVVVVWVCVGGDGRRGHGRTRAGAVWWGWICTGRGRRHVSLRGWREDVKYLI